MSLFTAKVILFKTNTDSTNINTVVKENVREEQGEKKLTLEEAKRRLPPPFRILEILPHGYKLHEIRLLHQGTFNAEVMFNYKNQSNELRVIEFNIVGEMAMSENYPAEDKIQQVEINGEKGVLVEHSRGGVTLTFNKDNIHYILNSDEVSPISPNEIIKIASEL